MSDHIVYECSNEWDPNMKSPPAVIEGKKLDSWTINIELKKDYR